MLAGCLEGTGQPSFIIRERAGQDFVRKGRCKGLERTILCFGDSNTWGYVPGGCGLRYPRNVRWPGRLAELLGSEYHVIEEGLNGRTIVWDDMIRGYCSGLSYITPCLQSHKPIDLVIVMLGSNDTKDQFSVDAYSIARSMTRLMDAIQFSRSGRPDGEAGASDAADSAAVKRPGASDGTPRPKILLIAPPPLRREILEGDLGMIWEMSAASVHKSEQLASFYEQIARDYSAYFLDAGKVCSPSLTDCLHLPPEGHIALAEAVCSKIQEIFK